MVKNLWEETVEVLQSKGHKWADVVQVRGEKFDISKENFQRLAVETNYDAGFGSQKIASDLMLIGDNWWYIREEYDGKEYWEYHTQPNTFIGATTEVQSLCCGYRNIFIGWRTLEEINQIGQGREDNGL